MSSESEVCPKIGRLFALFSLLFIVFVRIVRCEYYVIRHEYAVFVVVVQYSSTANTTNTTANSEISLFMDSAVNTSKIIHE